jgi:excisionase family DNA binding protein
MGKLLRLPTEEESRQARESLRELTGAKGPIRVESDDPRHPVKAILPKPVFNLLMDALAAVAGGKAVSVVPYGAQLTTQQAADFLNVSRPYLVLLLEKGEIPFHRVGTHRRIYFAELTSYKQRRDEASRAAARELTQMAQEDELGYE